MSEENKTEEKPYEKWPWALEPVEGIYCKERGCLCNTIDDKKSCMYNGCPYDTSGDDGMY